ASDGTNGAVHRALSPPGAARAGWDGGGLSGQTPGDRPAGGGKDGAGAAPRDAARPPPGDPRPGPPLSPWDRPHPGRMAPRGPALLRHGAPLGPDLARLARRPGPNRASPPRRPGGGLFDAGVLVDPLSPQRPAPGRGGGRAA